MEKKRQCPKCNSEMVKGFLPHYGAQKLGWSEKIKMFGMKIQKINAYACQQCGFVEMYIKEKE